MKTSNRLLACVAALALPSQAGAQSVYDLQLGMHRSAVEPMVGATALKRDRDRSSQSDETWYGPKFTLFFCKDYLSGIAIDIGTSVLSWTRAVEKETKDRGTGTLNVRSRVWASADLTWRLRDGGKFSIQMTEFGETDIKVMRWYNSEKPCPAP